MVHTFFLTKNCITSSGKKRFSDNLHSWFRSGISCPVHRQDRAQQPAVSADHGTNFIPSQQSPPWGYHAVCDVVGRWRSRDAL